MYSTLGQQAVCSHVSFYQTYACDNTNRIFTHDERPRGRLHSNARSLPLDQESRLSIHCPLSIDISLQTE